MPWQNNGGNQNPWGTGGPKRGGGGGGQPPDIDDLIKKGQDKLKGFLPSGFGGGNIISIILFVVVTMWALTGFYTVQPNQQGIVLRFGEWTTTTAPGLHWHLPYPIETVVLPNVTANNRIEVGFRSEAAVARRGRAAPNYLGESLMLTGDENIVDIEFTVFWRIQDAGMYLFNIQEPQTDTIKAISESVMREIIGRTDIQRALTQDRGPIQDEAQVLIQEVLD